MRRGTGIILAALGAVAVAVILLLTGATGKGDGPKPTPTATATSKTVTPCLPSDVVVTVNNKQGDAVVGAQVSVRGPYPLYPGLTPEFKGVTNEEGVTKIRLPGKGDYDINVTAAGYEKAILVGQDGQMIARTPKIKCGETGVQVDLDREGQVPPPAPPTATPTNASPEATAEDGSPTATPPPAAVGSFAFVYTQGVQDKEGVCRSLFAHRIIDSCDEINEPVPVQKSGSGWSTYVRSGQTVQVVGGVSYSDEAFWEVTFKSPRKDGLEVVYVQRKCGNVSAPPGKAIPPSLPFVPPGEEVPPSATPTSPTVSPTPPSATNTPVRTSTPVPPTATPRPATQTPEATPTQPVCPTCPPVYGEPTPGPVVATATRPAIINPTPTVEPPNEPPPPTATKPAGHPTAVP